MWQTKRSLLNILTHTLTFPVNLEGRQGGHLCCGGGVQPAGTVFIITRTNPRQKCRAVWPPAAACGRTRTINHEKSESRKGVEHPQPFGQARVFLCVWLWVQHTNGHVDFCDLRGAILETLVEAIRSPARRQVHGHTCRGEKQLNTLTNLIWLTT